MGLKGKGLDLWKWTFIVKQKNNSEGEALSKTKLHVMSLFHFSKNLFAFVITFPKSKITAFHSPFIQDAFWNYMHSGFLL